MGRAWIHAALAVASRFLIDLRVGPRTLELAAELVASVAMACESTAPPLLLIDNHLPYPAAILQVFGVIRHRRRKRGRGRLKHPDLKPPPGLLAGVVEKVRDATGNLLRVRTRALFGRRKDIVRRIKRLRLGEQINTAHIERLNGTLRTQQARLARRTRTGSRLVTALQCSLWLWRHLYNWTRPHRSLDDTTPAVALGLADQVWTVARYVECVVHVSDLQQTVWAESRATWLTSALEGHKRRLFLPHREGLPTKDFRTDCLYCSPKAFAEDFAALGHQNGWENRQHGVIEWRVSRSIGGCHSTGATYHIEPPPVTPEERGANLLMLEARLNREMKCFAGRERCTCNRSLAAAVRASCESP